MTLLYGYERKLNYGNFRPSYLNPFSTNVPFMDKPVSWFL